MRILAIGDIIGRPGRKAVQSLVPGLRREYGLDLVVANAENAAGGKGLTSTTADELFQSGVDVLTSGNHIWAQKEIIPYLDSSMPILRPLNYPSGVPGRGYLTIGHVMVVNVIGRTFMDNYDSPFQAMDTLLGEPGRKPPIIFVDFHAEATAEKIAMINYLDGQISALVGTHTHVQTSDERIFPNGTGYITDVGMTGPYESVIGMKVTPAINRFIYQTPQKYETAENDSHLCGMYFKVDQETGKTIELERILFPEFIRKID